jgi:hypothetical protein
LQQIRIKDENETAVLGSREERVELLRAGFTGNEIEALYVMLNSFDIVGVDWQGSMCHSA